MRITNHSMAAIPYIPERGTPGEIPAHVTLRPLTRKIILKIEHLPCKIEIAEEPEEENEHGR